LAKARSAHDSTVSRSRRVTSCGRSDRVTTANRNGPASDSGGGLTTQRAADLQVNPPGQANSTCSDPLPLPRRPRFEAVPLRRRIDRVLATVVAALLVA